MHHSRLLSFLMLLITLIIFQFPAFAEEGDSVNTTNFSKFFSQLIARQFVLKSPTFKFDGLRLSLKLADTTQLRCPNCWSITFEFDCRHDGYGDRTGKEVRPAITSHTAQISVEQFKVARAVLDDKWDMINQKPYGESGHGSSDPPTPEEIGAQVRGNSSFAFDLYQELGNEEGNFFYSPYSISLALVMAYAGARSETESQMAETLHFDLPQAKLHPVFKFLSDELAGRNQTSSGTGGFQLSVTNAAWGQEGYTFLDDYVDVVADNYAGGFRTVDFLTATEAARLTINNWVADQTRNRIPELIEKDILSDDTRLVLTNAVYFKADWQYPFKPSATRKGDFYLLDDQSIRTDMMHQTNMFQYAQGTGYQAIMLPYKGGELSMLIVLPDENQFDAFEGGLTADQLESVLNEMTLKRVEFSLPAFTFESSFDLKDSLMVMGMPEAFSALEADFSGITDEPIFYISNVIHKAFVAVDEKGTEAAAATAVSGAGGAAPTEPDAIMTVDRPFFFMIRDHKTATILFVGRVMNPAE